MAVNAGFRWARMATIASVGEAKWAEQLLEKTNGVPMRIWW